VLASHSSVTTLATGQGGPAPAAAMVMPIQCPRGHAIAAAPTSRAKPQVTRKKSIAQACGITRPRDPNGAASRTTAQATPRT
jgi:hypothetical protein